MAGKANSGIEFALVHDYPYHGASNGAVFSGYLSDGLEFWKAGMPHKHGIGMLEEYIPWVSCRIG